MLWRVNVIVVPYPTLPYYPTTLLPYYPTTLPYPITLYPTLPVTAKERSDSEPWAGHFKFKLNL